MFVANNWVMGNRPPAFDILYWNADNTRLPAEFHADLLRMFLENPLRHSGKLETLGTKIDMHKVKIPFYVVAGITDHITPWQACYATRSIVKGPVTFVLSSSGHIQSIVNPPSSPKAKFYLNPDLSKDADQWLAGATAQDGSWWTHWSEWFASHAGPERAPPSHLGSRAIPRETRRPAGTCINDEQTADRIRRCRWRAPARRHAGRQRRRPAPADLQRHRRELRTGVPVHGSDGRDRDDHLRHSRIGRSEMSWRPRRFAGLAQLTAKLLDRLGYPEVDVAGVSWGGALAQQVRAAVSESLPSTDPRGNVRRRLHDPGPPEGPVENDHATALSVTVLHATCGRRHLRRRSAARSGIITDHTSRIIAPKFMGYLYQLAAGAGWTSIHWLHRLKQPTLVMAGSEDPLVPAANARIISLLIPNNRLFMVPGGGHLFMLHSINVVAPVIRDFLLSKQPIRPRWN